MFWLFVLVMMAVGVLGYINSVNLYKDTILNLKKVKNYFDKIENGMSFNEVNSLMGSKSICMKENSLYKWYFGDSIVAQGYMKSKKSADIVSLSDFFKNYSKYFLRKGQAFVEIEFENGKVRNKKAVGLI